MIDETQFSSVQDERWSEISDFPGYIVSDWGRVMNEAAGRYLTPTTKASGYPMVGLMKDGVQNKRSLPLLIARAFVPQVNESHNTPINLDGDRLNNHYTNLMWRPLWFAREYGKQFEKPPSFNDPIEDVETHEVWKNSMHAATTLGLLDEHIRISMLNNTYVWPTGQIFREALH